MTRQTGLMIAEKLLPHDELTKIAKSILLAQDIYEESWNGKQYTKTHGQAAIHATNKNKIDNFWADIISHWNYGIWNDVQWWAEEILKKQSKIHLPGLSEDETKTLIQTLKKGSQVCLPDIETIQKLNQKILNSLAQLSVEI